MRSVHIKLPDELAATLEATAAQNALTKSEIIRDILNRFTAGEEPPAPEREPQTADDISGEIAKSTSAINTAAAKNFAELKNIFILIQNNLTQIQKNQAKFFEAQYMLRRVVYHFAAMSCGKDLADDFLAKAQNDLNIAKKPQSQPQP